MADRSSRLQVPLNKGKQLNERQQRIILDKSWNERLKLLRKSDELFLRSKSLIKDNVHIYPGGDQHLASAYVYEAKKHIKVYEGEIAGRESGMMEIKADLVWAEAVLLVKGDIRYSFHKRSTNAITNRINYACKLATGETFEPR